MPNPEGYPIVRRFVIRRHPVSYNGRSPWAMRDRERPHFLGHYASHALAMRAVDNILRRELGLPSRLAITPDEIHERMSA